MSANHGVLASRTAIELRVSRGNFSFISFGFELILVRIHLNVIDEQPLVLRAKFGVFTPLKHLFQMVRHERKELPKTEKSSINTSIIYSTHVPLKIAIIHLWNVPVHLQRPKGMLGRQKDPYGQSFPSDGRVSCGTATDTFMRAAFSKTLKSLAIMTGNLLSPSKNAYSRWGGKYLLGGKW
ncbi:hypothetical protein Tco_1044873 [Tanacetum coccineum]|uniref:Uncharacterized protein n=1 Tax=Tanacetum coccineum TaxID=301880 RepID=A0ABQ5GR52_9ASTR